MKQEKTQTFPLEIKKGSVRVKIYRTVDRGRDRFTLVYHEGERRVLRQFADFVDAKKEATITAEKLNAGQGDALELTGRDRDSYLHALHKLKPLKIGLGHAIDEYVEAKAVGVPLLTAAQLYRDTHNDKLPEVTVADAVAEFLEAKRKDGAAKLYLIDLKMRLGQFSRDFKVNLADVTPADLSAWLRGLELSTRSRRNHHNALLAFFRFARDEKSYLSIERKTAPELFKKAKPRRGAIVHFSPAEFAKLLSSADAELLPFLVLGGFCGLRTIEIKRLSWEDIRWTEGQIIISAETSKQAEARRRRIAPLTAPALAWLAGYKARSGKILSFSPDNLHRKLGSLCEAAGVTWKDNGLRHSFITYRVASTKDFRATAFEAGNSAAVIQSNYDAVVTETEGKLWFTIMPETAGNVVQITGAA